MERSTKVKWWLGFLAAIAAGIIAFVTAMNSGCAIAIDGRIATWAATPDNVPPPVPTWAIPNNQESTTKPAN